MSILNEYTILPRDFENMRFNPMAHKKDANLLMEFGALQHFRSFTGLSSQVKHLNRNLIIRYICIMYDPASPIYTENNEFKRKSLAAALAGIESDPEDGTFTPEWHSMINCEIEQVNLCIVDFVMLFNSPAYALLISTYEQYYKKLQLMNQVVKDEKKNVLEVEKIRNEVYKAVKLLYEDISALRIKILREENPYLAKTLYRTVNEETIQKLNLSPEAHVRARDKEKSKPKPGRPKRNLA